MSNDVADVVYTNKLNFFDANIIFTRSQNLTSYTIDTEFLVLMNLHEYTLAFVNSVNYPIKI